MRKPRMEFEQVGFSEKNNEQNGKISKFGKTQTWSLNLSPAQQKQSTTGVTQTPAREVGALQAHFHPFWRAAPSIPR